MKKLFLFTLGVIVLMFPIQAMCKSLTCDCTPVVDAVTGFKLQFGEAAWIDVPAVATCGTGTDKVTCTGAQKTLCYDISSLPIGANVVKGRALGPGGVSPDSPPFSFTTYGAPSFPTFKIVQ